ncbi:GNAT family N-acetyltransferase [Phenylobacterium sp.]|uniref:GNAT family N-acetyltransferase n=1 Tax=Phenylobacterium sp. TaxID=1871053 RepID=UPI0025D85CD2|nr:GNAT family N-acetyltransferase [Phenylobacterium sp.]
MSLRVGEAADAEAIGELTREAYAKWVPLIGREPLPMTIDYAQALKAHRFDLLHVGEELAGLIETVVDGEQLLVVNVAVRPAFQGRGFGVRLMALAEQIAADAGLAGVRLYTSQRFAANIALYASLGYGIDREEALNGGVAVHMSKRIEHPQAIAAAIACVEAFTERFNARDAAGMDSLLHFPHVILDGERLIVWKTAGQLPADFFERLVARGWRRSTYQDKRAVLSSPIKVHLLIEYSRDGEGGEVLSRHANLWIVTFENGRWGIRQRSY